MGPVGWKAHDVFLRTAVSVDSDGWAHFDYVKMPDYRWGIFLEPKQEGRTHGFGDFHGQPVWDEVPGEFRNLLRRLIVTQGDTEPASVEQQRNLGATAPSLYDLRNLFQVNVEEGRHLWAMVYLLHTYFGRDGREEAEELLARRSGDHDKPRILGAFNEPTTHWLSFFMFTMFTDRDGKYQLSALSESGFDPLSRTCKFMLTEEAHHMFVGETGVQRVVKRACELMKQPGGDVRAQGGIDLPTVQKYLNLWYTLSLGSVRRRGVVQRGGCVRRRDQGTPQGRQVRRSTSSWTPSSRWTCWRTARWSTRTSPCATRSTRCCAPSTARTARAASSAGTRPCATRASTSSSSCPRPSSTARSACGRAFGFAPDGTRLTDEEWNRRRGEWLPTQADEDYVKSLMRPVTEPGKMASWLAPPLKGINNLPGEFEYVKLP
jgi:benzoyl-CoA 2,3-dioxygenase component B